MGVQVTEPRSVGWAREILLSDRSLVRALVQGPLASSTKWHEISERPVGKPSLASSYFSWRAINNMARRWRGTDRIRKALRKDMPTY